MMHALRLRAAARRAAPAGRRWLSAAAGGELEDEASLFDTMEKPDVPKGWKMEKEAGTGYFRIKQCAAAAAEEEEEEEGKGGSGKVVAAVIIDCEVRAHDPDEDSTAFTALVTRNGITADFSLRTKGGELTLEGVTTYSCEADACALTPEAKFKRGQRYAGPAMTELEGTDLLPSILEFLDEHGVTPALGEYVHKQVQVAEQREYMGLLKDLKAMAA